MAALLGAVLLGLVAGLASAAFLSVTGEPSIEEAIAIEEANAARAEAVGGATGHEEPAEVSREVQRGAGLFGAYAFAGAAFGAIFGGTFLALRRWLPRPLTRALCTGAILAGAITVAPWFKYPPNPPAVGDPATLADRQLLYASVIFLALVVLVGATHLSARLRDARWVADQRLLLVAAAVVVPMAVLYAVMPPPPDEVAVPATLLWRFRIASLAGNLVLWTVLTLGFGVMAAAADRRAGAAAPTRR